MRNSTAFAAVLTIAIAAPLSAHAADGTISFDGEITDQTCTPVTTGGENFLVTLPTVASSALDAAGETAGRTGFAIALTNCPTGGQIATYFEPGPTVDASSGRLINSGTAGNVQVQLLGDNGQPISVQATSGTAQTNSQLVTVGSDGTANLDYAAEYYATAPTTPGDVTASVSYTIIYD